MIWIADVITARISCEPIYNIVRKMHLMTDIYTDIAVNLEMMIIMINIIKIVL